MRARSYLKPAAGPRAARSIHEPKVVGTARWARTHYIPDTSDSLDIGHILWGDAYRNRFVVGGAASRVCAGCAGRPALFRRSVSFFSHQPSNRLYLLEAISASRSGRFATAIAGATPAWSQSSGTLASTAQRVASPAPQLGTQEAAPAVARARATSGRHVGTLVAGTWIDDTSASASSARTATSAAGVDGTASLQSRLDGGLQGEFSYRRRRAPASVDGSGFVLPLRFVCEGLAVSTDRAGAPRISWLVSKLRSTARDSLRSRRAVGLHRAVGLVDVVGMVVAAGHPRGVYGQRTSRTERRA